MASSEKIAGPKCQRAFHHLTTVLKVHFGVRDTLLAYQGSEGRWHLLTCGASGCNSRVLRPGALWWERDDCAAAASLRSGEPAMVRCRDARVCPLCGHTGGWCVAAAFRSDGSVVGGLGCRLDADVPEDRVQLLHGFLEPLGQLMAECLELDARDPAVQARGDALSWAGAFIQADSLSRKILGEPLDLACRIVGVDVGGVCLVDGDDGLARLLAGKGIREELVGTRVPLDASLTGSVMRGGKAVIMTREEIYARGHPPLVAGLPPISALLGVPLRVGDRVLGAVHLAIREGADKEGFTDEDLENARTLGELISAVVDRARLVGDWRRKVDLHEQMLEASRSVSERRVDMNLFIVLKCIARMVGAEYAVLLCHPDGDPSQFEIAAVHPDSPNWVGARAAADNVIPREELRKSVAIIYSREDLELWEHPQAATWAQAVGGVPEEVMLVPVEFAGSTQALIGLIHTHGSTARFTWAQAVALRLVVRQIETTLDNARMLDMLDKKQRQLALLLRETHHRVKNSLQTVVSLIEMEEGELTAPIADSLGTLRRRIQHMARVHEMMAATPEGVVGLDSLLRSAVDCVASLSDETELRILYEIGEPRFVVPERAMPLAMVVHELALNALKHARPREVRISVRDGEGRVVIEVENDGVDAAAQRDRGAGLTLADEMVRHELHGRFEWAASDGRVIARIDLPEGEWVFGAGDREAVLP